MHLLKERHSDGTAVTKCKAEGVPIRETTAWWREVTCEACLALMAVKP